MHQPRGDPFFKQLKADIQEGIDSADRGDLASADEVRARFQDRRAHESTGSTTMYQPKGDPVFEQLKADIDEAVEEASRGEGIPAEQVFAEVYATIDETERQNDRLMPRLRIIPRARADLRAIASYLAEESPSRARSLIARIEDRCELLAAWPMRGRRRPEFGPNIRSFKFAR